MAGKRPPPHWYLVCGTIILGTVLIFRNSAVCTVPQMTNDLHFLPSLVQSTPASPAGFPRIIHQSWKTCDSFERPAHEAFTTTWKENHPQWEYRCWTDAQNRALIESYLPQYLAMYDGYPREIYRVDFARAAYMYVHGGVYADYDFVSVKPLDPLLGLLKDYGVILGTMGKDTKSDVRHFLCTDVNGSSFDIEFDIHVRRPR